MTPPGIKRVQYEVPQGAGHRPQHPGSHRRKARVLKVESKAEADQGTEAAKEHELHEPEHKLTTKEPIRTERVTVIKQEVTHHDQVARHELTHRKVKS